MKNNSNEPEVLISGYFGYDNCGDEAILFSMIKSLRRLHPGLEIVVLSGNPERTQELYGVRAVSRWNPFVIIKEMFRCKLFISGGGSLIQDVTSLRSAQYYLTLLWLAQFFRKKNMVFAQGIGPLSDEKTRYKMIRRFSKCNAIVLRDKDSADFLKILGLKNSIHVGADTVMTLTTQDVGLDQGKSILTEIGILDSNYHKTKPLMIVCLRNWGDNSFVPEVAKLLDNQIKTGCDVLLVPSQYPQDMDVISAVSNMMEERCSVFGKRLTAPELMSLIANADKVLSIRLHGLVFGEAFGVPITAISYDPKVRSFMEMCEMEEFMVPINSFNWFQLSEILDRQEAMTVADRLSQDQKREEIREDAWTATEIAINLLND